MKKPMYQRISDEEIARLEESDRQLSELREALKTTPYYVREEDKPLLDEPYKSLIDAQ